MTTHQLISRPLMRIFRGALQRNQKGRAPAGVVSSLSNDPLLQENVKHAVTVMEAIKKAHTNVENEVHEVVRLLQQGDLQCCKCLRRESSLGQGKPLIKRRPCWWRSRTSPKIPRCGRSMMNQCHCYLGCLGFDQGDFPGGLAVS